MLKGWLKAVFATLSCGVWVIPHAFLYPFARTTKHAESNDSWALQQRQRVKVMSVPANHIKAITPTEFVRVQNMRVPFRAVVDPFPNTPYKPPPYSLFFPPKVASKKNERPI